MEKIIEWDELSQYWGRADLLIDARTPAEYEEDHLPGALNVPMLTNEQRVEVGTLYKENAFEAKKLGATYITHAIHTFIASDTIRKAPKKTRILIYCARGGMRSGSLGTVLHHIGFFVIRLARGYKSYRQYVLDTLVRQLPQPVYVLYGYTGSGKTRIIEALREQVNVLDLEGIACHRGSLLGDLPGKPQPGQRAFETQLMEAIDGFDPARPTLIEGESRRVGLRTVPRGIWEQMKGGRHLWLEIPRAERVRYILEDYHELKNEALLRGPMKKLARYLSAEVMNGLEEDLAAGRWEPFVETLLEHHYDPLYARPNKRGKRTPLQAAKIAEAPEVLRRHILG